MKETLKNLFIRHKIKFSLLVAGLIFYYFSLPRQLFKDPTATIVYSREGVLLGAKIADDMQWRFPETEAVSYKFKKCIVTFEDAHFYKHWGFNPVSMLHAIRQNRKAGRIVRGGSTLTQQVIRLYRKNKGRTYFEKAIELILATRLEFKYSKEKILSLYASHAPFGGNTVGINAAAWRFFGQEADQLSWAESATLAVLPNSPGLIHVDKNREKLLKKRNALLLKLFKNKLIDSTEYHLSIQEPLPEKTFPLPQIAPHLVSKMYAKHKGENIVTSIDVNLQNQVNQIVNQHYLSLKQNQIYNAAVLVVDVHTRKVLAYVGNTLTDKAHQKDVDVIDKPRSTGSILKPFLYNSMLSSGIILPHTLIPDIPTQIGGYRPENFDLEYQGAVPAGKALAKSLNIPAVKMLQEYGIRKFYDDLQKIELNNINKGADHYGLSLILGGAESNLWDLCRAYAAMASTVNHYDQTQGKYYKNELSDLILFKNQLVDFGKKQEESDFFDAGSAYTTLQTLKEVNRPEGEENWEFYNHSHPISWKTGTSFGFRDAWAIGITPDFVIGVWVGNSDGEGRPDLTGLQTAAPILFDVFKLLPFEKWFLPPYDDMEKIPVCSKSGHRATELCELTDSIWVPRAGIKTELCSNHTLVHLDQTETYQVNSSCYPTEQMVHKSWFVLPPSQAYYYQLNNPFYKALPPFRKDCLSEKENLMEFVTPFENEQIFLPKDFDEQTSQLVLKVKHNQPDTKIYWYLDQKYMTTTTYIHELAIQPVKGTHVITIVDELGNEKRRIFKIL